VPKEQFVTEKLMLAVERILWAMQFALELHQEQAWKI
jgi:hypothetical protein